MRILLAVIAMLFVAGGAQAQLYRGDVIHRMCTDTKGLQLLSGYIGGVLDKAQNDYRAAMFTGLRRSLRQRDLDELIESMDVACVPEGIPMAKLIGAVCVHAANNPEDRHLTGAQLVTQSLRKAYPCGNVGSDKRPASRWRRSGS
jgi:hypothetical protein